KRGVAGAIVGGTLPALLPRGGGVLRGRIVAGEASAPQVQRIVNARILGPDGVSSFPTTGRPAAMPSQLHADPLAGTGVFLSKFPEEVRGGIRDILEANNGFEAQRRGVVDPETTARLAQGVVVDLSQRLKAGTALNAHGVRAYANALATAQDRINGLAQKV